MNAHHNWSCHEAPTSRIEDWTEDSYLQVFFVSLSIHYDLNVCLCVTEVGSSGGGTRVVTCDLRTYLYILVRGHDNK